MTTTPTSDYEHLYREAATEIVYHEDDENLDTIRIKLPKCPNIKTIDGYGLHPKQQMWRRPSYPHRLRELEYKFQTVSEIKDFLQDHQAEYEDEIDFIEKQWYRRRNGYWFYCDGVPTYIDGWHYFYLSWWKIDIGLPEYRSRDRKFFIFARFCYNDSTMPDGTDLKRRICYGFNYPKYRREGATYKADCIGFCIVTDRKSAQFGLQSMDGASAKKTFLKAVVAPFKKLPFFFKPIYDGSSSPKAELVFDVPPVRKGGLAKVEVGLESEINFADTASENAYDGTKLYYYHDDETGKTELCSVYTRWQVVRKCLSQGNGVLIHGFCISTSTVGEMSEKGGRNFFDLCKGSHYSKRNSLGQTETGKYNLFIPSYDGLEGFIDIYGNSIIDDPEEKEVTRWKNPVRDSTGKLIGAKRYLDGNRDMLLLEDTAEALSRYEEEVRQFPLEFNECFISKGAGSGLNLKKITIRIKELQCDNTITKRVNYRWENNIKDTKVLQTEDPNGRWIISLDLPQSKTNLRAKKQLWDGQKIVEAFAPTSSLILVASADPFRFTKVEGKRLSNAAGSIFWPRDFEVDPVEKPMSLWESHRNIVTYSNRPLTGDDFAEDMLMMCVYWGCMMYPEINVSTIWDHFDKRGYGGYLLYAKDLSGKKKATPGFYALAQMQQQLFIAHKNYIEDHGLRERHIEYLLEAKSIKGIEDLHLYDLFTSVGGGYLGAEHLDGGYVVLEEKQNDLKSYFGPGKRF